MPVTTHLFAYGLRSVLALSEETASRAAEVAGQILDSTGVAGKILGLLHRHFTDHGQALPLALNTANDRAWQALAVSLAGNGLLDRIKGLVAGPVPQAVEQQVKAFLAENANQAGTTSEQMRRACLAELQQARKKGLLALQAEADEIARQSARYRGLADPGSLTADAKMAVLGVADALAGECPNLVKLLRQGADGDEPPLLVVAFGHFFRREVATNKELARELTFDLLQKVAARQESALDEVGLALNALGGRFDGLMGEVLEQLSRMESKIDDLRERIEDLARKHDVQKDATKSRFYITITNEREQALARTLLEEVRKLPPEAQNADLLTLMADVLRAAGRFKDARETYSEASKHTEDKSQQAASLHKAYLAALEERRWEEALQALTEAVTLEPQRYAPFPWHQYQVKRILGAGGFGAVFLCQDRYMRAEVVVKGLLNTDMERSLEDAFGEAHVLRHLSREHPSIIGVQHCSYADAGQSRPYIVMDYFDGVSLQAYLDDLGDKPLPLEDFQPIAWQIAVGMKAAHGKGVLHRDLKPDNVLVKRAQDGWQVRIIDFGLAIRTRAVQVSTSVPMQERTLSGESAAGTAKYAAPEQMGEMPGVKPGPYSDVYAFGRLCCYALFRETEPRRRQWASLPEELAGMLETCIERRVSDRHADFGPIVAVLAPKSKEMVGKQEEEARRKEAEEAERRKAKAEEEERAERQRQAEKEREARLREEAERQKREAERLQEERREAEKRQRKANLARWKEAGEPNRWVEAQQGQWNHQDWLALVERVKRSAYWPLDEVEMGAVLREVGEAWRKERRERQEADREQQRKDMERKAKRQEEAEREKCEAERRESERRESEQRQKKANLTRWKEAGEPNRWVEAQKGQWNHQDWLALVERVKRSAYWPLDEDEMGAVLQEVGEAWRKERREKQEAERQKAEQEQAAKRKREQEQARRQEGEKRLAQAHKEALDRSGGKNTADVGAIAREYGIALEWAEAIRDRVALQWQKEKPTKDKRRPGEIITTSVWQRMERGFLGFGVKKIDVTMKFVWCPPGTFLMGRPASESGAGDKVPQHWVTLTKGFYLGVYQVIQSQWEAVMGRNPSRFKGENRPVENVSWEDCQEFCKKLGERDGKKYRLPTEAEWEYACRAGTTTEYHSGNGFDALSKVGWCSYDGNWGSAKETKPVGQFKPNGWGLYDMHGNVWEWCLDGMRSYQSEDIKDPIGPQGARDARVLRGGSWDDDAVRCRATYRSLNAPSHRGDNVGCRVLLSLD